MVKLISAKRQVIESRIYTYKNQEETESHYNEMLRDGWEITLFQPHLPSKDEDEDRWISMFKKVEQI